MKYCPNRQCSFFNKVGHPAEYEDTASKCSDCESALVTEKPELGEPDHLVWDKMTPLMNVPDSAQLTVIEGLLASAGIRHHVHGDNVQDLFGVGRIGSGFNLALGQPVLFVDTERLDEVRELLSTVPGVSFDDEG